MKPIVTAIAAGSLLAAFAIAQPPPFCHSEIWAPSAVRLASHSTSPTMVW